MRNANPLFGDIDRIVPLPLEFLKRHLTRSEVFPNLTETNRAHKSSLLLFLRFVHFNHNLMYLRCKDKYFLPNFQIFEQRMQKKFIFALLSREEIQRQLNLVTFVFIGK